MMQVTPEDVIYLDHAATTPLDPGIRDAMLPYFTEKYGNPSSMYSLGQESRSAVDRARHRAALVLDCDPSEVVFTSGATESNNLALRGVAWAARLAEPDAGGAPHIVTTAIEHHAVLHTVQSLERQGFAATYVLPDHRGIVDPEAIAAAVKPETCLVSVMYANNETGATQPVREIAAVARAAGIPFHTDAVQAAGMLSLRVDDFGADLLSLSAHKFYGPKGVGLLYVRRGTAIDFQQLGGSQEQGRRGGTENVPGIVGLGLAIEQAEGRRESYVRHCRSLRERFQDHVLHAIPDARVNGPLEPDLRLPNNLNVAIAGVAGEMLVLSLDLLGVAASTGSACTTGKTEPSHVLLAMGLPEGACRSALRFTVGQGNTAAQMDRAAAALAESVARARTLAATGVG